MVWPASTVSVLPAAVSNRLSSPPPPRKIEPPPVMVQSVSNRTSALFALGESLMLIVPLFFVAGYIFEKGLIRPLAGRKENVRLASSVLVTLGAALILEDLAAFFSAGTQFEKSVDLFLPTLVVAGLYLPTLKLLVFGLVVVLIVGLFAFLKYTYLGLAVQAVTQNPRGAILNGVNISRINAIAFGLGSMLAAAAGGFEMTTISSVPGSASSASNAWSVDEAPTSSERS